MEVIIEKFRGLTKYWWALLLLGIATVIVGIMVFVHPATSYKTLALMFAAIMLVSGIMNLILAFSESYLQGRGWVAVGGALETILGLILLINPVISIAFLPYLLAFWMMVHGFGTIGLATDLRRAHVSGMGWSIFIGILLVLCGTIIMFVPSAGIKFIIFMLGAGLLIAGFTISAFAIEIYGINKTLQNENVA